jgi:hypothetical protein
MALELDFLTQITNVHWGGAEGFLFIGSTGVYSSEDGEDWGKLADGFAANGVAYGRKLWVAATDGGMMISDDQGETWAAGGGPGCEQLVFAGPSIEENPEEDAGTFYALSTDVDEGNGDVYSSVDGQTWNRVLRIPDFDFRMGPGINGYAPGNLQTQGSTVVLTADQWTTVETTDDQAGRYTRAAKYTGSDGSISGPVVYGPEGNASIHNNQAENTGAGAARDESIRIDYLGYLETVGTGLGSQISRIVVNGSAVATSEIIDNAGTDINGGINMAAADGIGWFLANEITLPALTIKFYAIDLAGSKSLLIDAGSLSTTSAFFGHTCVLPKKEKDSRPIFCTIVSATHGGVDSGGVWTNSGSGWRNTFSSKRGAVNVGKIAIAPPPEPAGR